VEQRKTDWRVNISGCLILATFGQKMARQVVESHVLLDAKTSSLDKTSSDIGIN
jgi:hypothetical protein